MCCANFAPTRVTRAWESEAGDLVQSWNLAATREGGREAVFEAGKEVRILQCDNNHMSINTFE